MLEFARLDEPQDPHAFRFEPQGYTLRTPGGARKRFDIAWNGELLAELEAIRRPDRDPAVVQRVGEVMRQALASIGWDSLGEQVWAASETGRGAVVTLRSNAAELYSLPWELVTVGQSGQHLGELPGVLLRHEWPATTTTGESPSPRHEGGRVLLAWSAAGARGGRSRSCICAAMAGGQARVEARARLAHHVEHLDWASLQLYAREADGDDTRPVVFRPYRGLLSFEAAHRRFFFGRDAERKETLGDMQAPGWPRSRSARRSRARPRASVSRSRRGRSPRHGPKQRGVRLRAGDSDIPGGGEPPRPPPGHFAEWPIPRL